MYAGFMADVAPGKPVVRQFDGKSAVAAVLARTRPADMNEYSAVPDPEIRNIA
jgi:hypothetical protein